MGKNRWNKNQKRILYKNMGILLALTALSAILARSGLLNRGETLQELAERQEAQASTTDAPSAPEKELSPPESNESPPKDKTTQPETIPDSIETPPVQQEETPAMSDRVIYQESFYYESLNDTIKT